MTEWHPLALMQVLFIVAVANGVPILAKKLFGDRLAHPLDFGVTLRDGCPLLGRSKTMRGLLLAVIFSALFGFLLGPDVGTGFLIGLAAMAGDLLSSFIKRRLGLAPSSMAPGLDQVPESLLPLLVVYDRVQLGPADVVIGVAAFWVGGLVISRLLFAMRIRDRPY
ncbi:MAG: CDP-archaeol synthase [Burkholderiales bacterium]|nr:CDP-archaeol synthase [Burkholderiales bacterium]